MHSHLEGGAEQVEGFAVSGGRAIGVVARNPALDGIGMQQIVLNLGGDVLLVDLHQPLT